MNALSLVNVPKNEIYNAVILIVNTLQSCTYYTAKSAGITYEVCSYRGDLITWLNIKVLKSENSTVSDYKFTILLSADVVRVYVDNAEEPTVMFEVDKDESLLAGGGEVLQVKAPIDADSAERFNVAEFLLFKESLDVVAHRISNRYEIKSTRQFEGLSIPKYLMSDLREFMSNLLEHAQHNSTRDNVLVLGETIQIGIGGWIFWYSKSTDCLSINVNLYDERVSLDRSILSLLQFIMKHYIVFSKTFIYMEVCDFTDEEKVWYVI